MVTNDCNQSLIHSRRINFPYCMWIMPHHFDVSLRSYGIRYLVLLRWGFTDIYFLALMAPHTHLKYFLVWILLLVANMTPLGGAELQGAVVGVLKLLASLAGFSATYWKWIKFQYPITCTHIFLTIARWAHLFYYHVNLWLLTFANSSLPQ